MNDRVRDSDVDEAHFSEEFKKRGESPTLNSAPGKHTKTSAEKSTGLYVRDTYRNAGASPCVYRGQESIPKLDISQEEAAASRENFRHSLPPRERYQDFQEDDLPCEVTRRGSRLRFRSPHEDDALAEYPVSRQMIKPATYDGNGPWRDYHAHFEACAELNAWNYNKRGLYLAVSLRGNAQGVLGNMPNRTKLDYHTLVKALEDRFAPPSQTELYRVQMRERRQRVGESLPEFGQAIRRLANLAYPMATAGIFTPLL
jgi:hypothetical protein